jgi:hypothetical protein
MRPSAAHDATERAWFREICMGGESRRDANIVLWATIITTVIAILGFLNIETIEDLFRDPPPTSGAGTTTSSEAGTTTSSGAGTTTTTTGGPDPGPPPTTAPPPTSRTDPGPALPAVPAGYVGRWRGRGFVNGDPFLDSVMEVRVGRGNVGDTVGTSLLVIRNGTECRGELELAGVHPDGIELIERGSCGTQQVVLTARAGNKLELASGAVGNPRPSTRMLLTRQQ